MYKTINIKKMKGFGEHIRLLRLSRKMLLRQVAAQLEIDPSLLSRIESGVKMPTREQVIRLSTILGEREDAMLVHYLSDRVVYELKDEKLAIKAMRAAESKITYMKRKEKK